MITFAFRRSDSIHYLNGAKAVGRCHVLLIVLPPSPLDVLVLPLRLLSSSESFSSPTFPLFLVCILPPFFFIRPSCFPDHLPRSTSLVRPFDAILDKRHFSYMYAHNSPFEIPPLTSLAISRALWCHWVSPQTFVSLVSPSHRHATSTDSTATFGT